MHLKLGKSFAVLKFKPSILEPLRLDFKTVENLTFNVNQPLSTFEDIIKIDFLLAVNVKKAKRMIETYILAVQNKNLKQVLNAKGELKRQLETILEIVEKLDMENFEKDISELFRSSNGIYSLFRYVWQPDLLQRMIKLKTLFEAKF